MLARVYMHFSRGFLSPGACFQDTICNAKPVPAIADRQSVENKGDAENWISGFVKEFYRGRLKSFKISRLRLSGHLTQCKVSLQVLTCMEDMGHKIGIFTFSSPFLIEFTFLPFLTFWSGTPFLSGSWEPKTPIIIHPLNDFHLIFTQSFND